MVALGLLRKIIITRFHDIATSDWIVRSRNRPLVFGVVRKVGIVHLAGAGSLKLVTGKVFDFK